MARADEAGSTHRDCTLELDDPLLGSADGKVLLDALLGVDVTH